MTTRRTAAVIVSIALSSTAACVATAAPSNQPFAIDMSRSSLDRAARPFKKLYDGPLVDAQSHVVTTNRKTGVEDAPDLVEALDSAGVARLVLLPTPNDARMNRPDVMEIWRSRARDSSGGRILTACGGPYFSVWMDDTVHSGRPPEDLPARLARLTGELSGSGCAGAGEIGYMHYNKTGKQGVIQLPMAYPPLLAAAEVAAKAGKPFYLHAESREPNGARHEEETFGTIAALFKQSPKLTLICTSGCFTTAANARALLKAYPGLMMTIKNYRNPEEWSHLEPVTNLDGNVFEDWGALLDDMPDRFMIGMDFMFSRIDSDRYDANVRKVRLMLGSLKLDAARKIAAGNAERVFGALPH